jgi:hypothetical protein
LTFCKEMKMLLPSLIAMVIACASVGCEKAETTREVTGGSGHGVDVTVNGVRYYGIANESKIRLGNQEYSEFSSVLLSPWNNRAGSSVGVTGDTSRLGLTHGELKIQGRHVCIVDPAGTRVVVYPAEIPVDAFRSPETLAAAVAGIIEEAEQAGTGQPATRTQLKPEGGDKPQPEAEGRSR